MMRQATWANVGIEVAGSKNVMEAMQKAGLNYNVVLKDVFLGNGQRIDGVKATVREDDSKVYGTVSDSYGVIQNVEAFEFANNLVSQGLKFEKAGETKSGKIWLIGSMPQVKVLDDKMKPFVILQNSHNRQCSLKAAITPLRVVCQNQFSYAFKHVQNVVSLKHSQSIKDRMHEAQSVLIASNDYMQELKEFADEMAVTKLSKNRVSQILDQVFPQSEEFTDAKNERQRKKKNEVFYIYNNCEDLANYHGTAYGLVQAYSDFITHREADRKTATGEEMRFAKLSFDPNIMNSFVDTVRAMA